MNQPLETYGIQSSTGYLQQFVIVKPENESRTNTAAFADDKDLIVPVGPNQILTWRATLFFGANGPGNAKTQWVPPLAFTDGCFFYKYIDPTVTFLVNEHTNAGYNAADLILTNIASQMSALYEGRLENGANGGYFKLQWAQNAANLAATTLLRGSRLEAWIQ